jgi:predicted transcriptional regulator
MDRLNLTLDPDTSSALNRHARRHRRPRAALARELIREGLERREARERAARLARDYANGRNEALDLLKQLEGAQLDLLDEP